MQLNLVSWTVKGLYDIDKRAIIRAALWKWNFIQVLFQEIKVCLFVCFVCVCVFWRGEHLSQGSGEELVQWHMVDWASLGLMTGGILVLWDARIITKEDVRVMHNGGGERGEARTMATAFNITIPFNQH